MKLISTKQYDANLIHLAYSADCDVFTGEFEAHNSFQIRDLDAGIGVAEMQIDMTDGDISKDEIAEVFIELVKRNTETDLVLDEDFESAHIDDFVNMVNEAGGKGYLINASSKYDTCIAFLPIAMVHKVFEI